MGLIYCEGGPLDGRAYQTESLTSGQFMLPEIIEYRWTSDTKVSERTGAVAQIWRHKDGANTAYSAQPSSEPVAAPQATSQAAPQSAEQPAPTPAAASATATTPQQTEATPATEQPAAPVAAAPSVDGQSIDGESLLARRNALKLSRGKVSDRAKEMGTPLAHSKIGAIESNGGKRVTDEERRQLAAVLTDLESK